MLIKSSLFAVLLFCPFYNALAFGAEKILIAPEKNITIPKPDNSKIGNFYFYTNAPVLVNKFEIQKHETTCAEFYNFLTSNIKSFTTADALEGLSKKEFLEKYECDDPDLPVSKVSWDMASRYCKKNGGRLPSQIEWIVAASVALNDNDCYPEIKKGLFYPVPVKELPLTKTSRLYECLKSTHTEEDEEDLDLQSIGSQKYDVFSSIININGTYGMFGNLWEWTADEFLNDPDNLYKFKIIKGGSFTNHQVSKLYDSRIINFLEAGNNEMDNVGFRCVWDTK